MPFPQTSVPLILGSPGPAQLESRAIARANRALPVPHSMSTSRSTPAFLRGVRVRLASVPLFGSLVLVVQGGLLGLLLAGAAMAHGGQYVGPPPGAPNTGGGGGGLPGPISGRPATSAGGSGGLFIADWEVWWDLNSPELLGIRESLRGPAASAAPTSQPITQVPTPGVPVVPYAATADDRRKRIIPALVRTLKSDRSKDVISGALLALGKCGEDGIDEKGGPIPILPALAEHLRRPVQEVRETAALAIGVTGRAEAFQPLADLLADRAAGRRLLGRNVAEVDDRTQAFAAYGLGFLALRTSDGNVKRQVHASLSAVLMDRKRDDRDLRVAVIQGFGLLKPDLSTATGQRLQWTALEELWTFFGDRYRREQAGAGQELVFAHVPTSIARLLGRGSSAAHQQAKARLAEILMTKKERGLHLRRSCIQALGFMTLPVEDPAASPADNDAAKALHHVVTRGRDNMTKHLAWIARGRIGGESHRSAMLKALPRAQDAVELPWIALGLGLQARARRLAADPVVDKTVAIALLRELKGEKNPAAVGALSIALGLVGDPTALPALQKRLAGAGKLPERKEAYTALGLGLLHCHPAVQQMRGLALRSLRHPRILVLTTIALGVLGDRGAGAMLVKRMRESDTSATFATLSGGIGVLGDRGSLDLLLDMLEDESRPALARAFAATAVGNVAEESLLPWNTEMTRGVNWMAAVTTLLNGSTGVLDLF